MRLKNAVLRCNKKGGKSGSLAPKCKMAENLLRIDRHRPKIGPNQNFLGYSNSPWTGTNMHTWFNELNKFWWKVPAFPKYCNGRAKNKKTLRNPVSVFRCTFELTALLSKKFHLRLHCYTLRNGLSQPNFKGTESLDFDLFLQISGGNSLPFKF